MNFLYCEGQEFLKCHIPLATLSTTGNLRRKNRISHADRKVWNFENKAFLKNIVMLCLLKLHRLVILFSSPASVFRPSQLTSKTKCTTLPSPPVHEQCLTSTPPFTNSVWHQPPPFTNSVWHQPPPRSRTVFDINFRWKLVGEKAQALQLLVLRWILTPRPPSFKTFDSPLSPAWEVGGEYRLQIDHCLAQHCTEKAVVTKKVRFNTENS